MTAFDPDRRVLRERLLAARQALPDRLERAVQLQTVLRGWLVGRRETRIGAYWPIKGEFDPLPALYRWQEGAPEGTTRQIGLPVVDKASGQLRFHVWFPGCPMEEDAYGIPKPKDTEAFDPELLLVPCVGFGPAGLRLGYGGGFVDRTLAALQPRPWSVGLAYAHGFLPLLRPLPGEACLDTLLTEEGVMWERG
ncbi:MAG: 5-formyltetrahydrofolate cyclo-ligase [Caldimonas sp.]|uniref:5-formyltetrahydrofolate cyclo-ligase n=1 Tax=Caldimonas sp. TaxID=2838790 RepID=UPI00391993CB